MCKKGHIPWNKGIPRTQKEKDNISNSKKGKKYPKISQALKGKKHSEESKKKNSETAKRLGIKPPIIRMFGDKNPVKRLEVRKKISKTLTGRTDSEETKKKKSISNSGKIRSNESKIKYSECKRGNKNYMYGRYGNKNPMFGKVPKFSGKGSYYESPLQGKIWLRSSYELAYVKYLDENKILWYYEIETFDLGDTTYTPDFFLPQFEKFIEIKGFMRYKDQEKINKFQEEYPWNLEILRKEDLIKLGVKL